jgi:hypothetical protein
LLNGVAFAQDAVPAAAPTMQDVLNGLEDTNPAVTKTAPEKTDAPAAPNETVIKADDIKTETPPPTEAPALETMNPALAPPAAPTAERAETAPTPPKPPQYIAGKFAELGTLDKVTARTGTLTVPVGETVAIGPLFLQVKTCQRSAPLEQPDSAAFIQVWEAVPKDELATTKNKGPSQWVFSGWMFESSPALSAMDHPIYDIWVLSCKNDNKAAAEKSDAKKTDGAKEAGKVESDKSIDKPKAASSKD